MNRRIALLFSVDLVLAVSALTSCGGNGGVSPQPVSPSVSSVAASCTPADLSTGQTSQCSAVVSGTGNYSSSVTWSVSPANAGTINASGVFTSAAVGTATITATSTEDSTKSGNATVTVTLAAPSNLVYSQTTISAFVGQPITPDSPTVTGSASSYSVSPALPAGLTINSSTGTIQGTPTAATAQAAYTVTATNASGSTTATIQIKVTLAAPSNLLYPQTTITAIVGQPITPDSPTVTGSVSSYIVSPALPAGLSMDPSTGTIQGTPTAAAAQAAYTVTATNASGSTTATIQIKVTTAATSNLVYPWTTISAFIGQPITPDLPTTTGPVSSYSVSPALPAGLSIAPSSGTIWGTPTAVAALATYTVTATNASGSTTAAIQIKVTTPALSHLVYSQTTISAFVGQPITPDSPTVTGSASSYSVSPALPAGLSMNPSTGTIQGTPTAATAQAAYTVTATNASGSTTATIQIKVIAGQVLLDLGLANQISSLQFVGDTVLAVDQFYNFELWNYTSGAVLLSGSWALGFQMAGQTLTDYSAGFLEIRALSDGHLLTKLVQPTNNPWTKLAYDGSYVCFGSQTGLFIYTLSGQLAVAKPGDYSQAKVFEAPGQVLVAMGPAGQNVIESISITNGASTVSSPFSGSFNSWFLDGSRFTTNLSNTVWVYSNTGVQQAIVSLPTIANLSGEGNWIWTYDPNAGPTSPLEIYAIGASNPSFTLNLGVEAQIFASGTTIGVLPYGTGQVSVIDLSGSNPSKTDYSVPIAYLSAFAASSPSKWVVGNKHGVTLDGASASTTPRYFCQGTAWSIAGSSGSVALSTANGKIGVFDPYQSTLEESIDFSAGKVALSTDGSVLGAFANANDAQYETDRTLNFYSLPAKNVISTFPYTFDTSISQPILFDFTLAGSGTTIGQVTGIWGPWVMTQKVTDISGSSAIWSDTINSGSTPDTVPILLSPDGTLIASNTSESPNPNSSTNIIQNGVLVAAVPGFAVGWIDNDRLLVNQYVQKAPPLSGYAFAGSTVYSPAGVPLATPALPQLNSIQTVNSDSVYDPSTNAIYSLTTGQATWTGSLPSSGIGAVSGAYVVYQSGNRVVVESY